MDAKQRWFENLEEMAKPTLFAAKYNAAIFDCGIWELPSGKFVSLQQGLPVPDGAELVARRVTPRGSWRPFEREEML